MKLRTTSLCLDCEDLYEGLRCPVCASEASAYLTRWIPSYDDITKVDLPLVGQQPVSAAADTGRRRGPDRRRHSRGGRRPEDRSGHAPLVFVVSRDAVTRELCEQHLLARQFAVVPCDGAGSAVETLRALRPDVVVTDLYEAPMLRERALPGRHAAGTPIVEIAGTIESADLLLESIRRALRAPAIAHR